jgi:two-component system, OmpR family, phosphate regulon sensor histidine kinase PhoR
VTARIFAKLLLGSFCLLAVAMAAVDYFATRVMESSYVQNLTGQLATNARLIALALPAGLDDQAAARMRAMAHDAGARLTVIGRDGRVVIDSDAEPAKMENHAGRAEFIEALAGRLGS